MFSLKSSKSTSVPSLSAMAIELASTWLFIRSPNALIAASVSPLGATVSLMRSVISNPLSLRMFCMRLISSRAMPSFFNSGVSSTSRATVKLPSLLTSHPGISSEMMSTSAASTVTGLPSTSNDMEPSFSSDAISSWDKPLILAATPFMSLPNFLPMTRKLHFTFLTRIP